MEKLFSLSRRAYDFCTRERERERDVRELPQFFVIPRFIRGAATKPPSYVECVRGLRAVTRRAHLFAPATYEPQALRADPRTHSGLSYPG